MCVWADVFGSETGERMFRRIPGEYVAFDDPAARAPCRLVRYAGLTMVRKKISKLWLAWAVIIGGLCILWIYSLGSLETCLYDRRGGTYWCVGQGSLSIESGITRYPPPEYRFELSTSVAGDTITYPALKLPLLVPLGVMLFGVPAIRVCIHAREKWLSRSGRQSSCPRCGYRRPTVESASCPKCSYTTYAALSLNESVSLPCPTCQYDLRGLADGECPECGTPFLVADLEPEQPGLVLESWHQAAKTLRGRATLPLAIAFSPIRAFRRRCSVHEILKGSPARAFLWCLLWYAAILVVGVGIHFGLDKLQGVRLVLGGYWNYPGSYRFGSAAMLPVHVPIAWLECLLVSCIGMAIAFRPLSPRQTARLATWLFALALLAGIVATVYELSYQEVLAPNLFLLPIDIEWAFRLRDFGSELMHRSFDIVLGLTAGLAVGTVLQRRRWAIAITAAVLLAVAFPALASIQRVYAMSVYFPLRELVLGPPEAPPPGSMLPLGPTFQPGASTPVFAGTWSVHYDNVEQPEVYLTFDLLGSLTRLKVAHCEPGDSGEFLADGQQHEAPVPDGNDNVDAIHYRVLSGSEYAEDEIVLHIRLERDYRWRIRDDFFEELPDIAEETLSGILSDDGDVITGTSVLIRDVPGIEFQPGEQQRSFIMERVPSVPPDP